MEKPVFPQAPLRSAVTPGGGATSGDRSLGHELASSRGCLQCNRPVGGDGSSFCCRGCETVYGLLGGVRKSLGPTVDFEGWKVAEGVPALLYIEGIHCSTCVWLLERLGEFLPTEVEWSRLDLGRSVLTVHMKQAGALPEVARMIAAWGYRPRLLAAETEAEALIRKENRRHLLRLGVSGALAGNVMLLSIPYYAGAQSTALPIFEGLSLLLAAISLFYCGKEFLVGTLTTLKKREFSIDVPITFALVAAFGLSVMNLARGSHEVYFDSMSALVFFLLASRYLLLRFRQRGFGGSEFLDFESTTKVEAGETVLLDRPGRLVFDAQVMAGEGYVDTALLTGENSPMRVGPADYIFAGTELLSVSTPLRVLVLATGKQSRVQKILTSARLRRANRSRVEFVYDRWAKRILIFMSVLGAAGMAAKSLDGSVGAGLQMWITLLVVTCPCALALGVPLTLRLAIRKAFREGLLIQDPDVFEKALNLKRAYLDKTGTLTEGRLEVCAIEIPMEDRAALAALVRLSRHPVSRAILAELSAGGETGLQSVRMDGGSQVCSISDFREIPSLGIEAVIGSQKYQLVKASTGVISPGRIRVRFFREGRALGRIDLQDLIRTESSAVVRSLHDRGLLVGILSGDRFVNAQRVGHTVSADFVEGDLSPEGKLEYVQSLESAGMPVLMVGDGVNDAAALSAASVSFGVRGALDEVLKSATVVSSREGIAPLLRFFELSDQVRSVLRRNLWISTTYNLGAAVLTLSGWMSPLVAALVMPLAAASVFSTTAYSFRVAEPILKPDRKVA